MTVKVYQVLVENPLDNEEIHQYIDLPAYTEFKLLLTLT